LPSCVMENDMKGAFSKSTPWLIRCDKGYSFYHNLVERYWPGNGPLHRLCSLARKMGVRSYVREVLVPTDEIRQEIDAVAAYPDYAGSGITGQAVRLSFFRSLPKAWQEVTSKDLLGYAVILELRRGGKKWMSYVLEAVVRPPTIFVRLPNGQVRPESVSNYYVHCTRPFDSVIGTQLESVPLELEGSFFCQQNGLTHVCVHAALRAAINSSPSIRGPRVPEKLTNIEINKILGFNYANKSSMDHLRGGLEPEHIEAVIKELGLRGKAYDFPNPSHIGYAEYVYPLIESRFPVILAVSVQKVKHAIAVMGHTVNSDRWGPQAKVGYGAFPLVQYHSSVEWADHFIIADDNVGMYVTLPREMIRNFLAPEFDPNLHATMAVGVVPNSVNVFGYDAEASASGLVEQFLRMVMSRQACWWLKYLRGHMRKKVHRHPALVCRTVLTKRDQYCDEMERVRDSMRKPNRLTAAEVQMLRGVLPKTIWVTEISLPDLYSANKHKIGDFVTDAGASRAEYEAFRSLVFGWLPGVAYFNVPKLAKPFTRDWSLKGHIRLFRHARGPLPALEW
jgi:hypothetical protein